MSARPAGEIHDDPPSERRPARSVRGWLTLLVVWSAGLAMWALYIVFAFLILARLFSSGDQADSG